MGLFPKHAAEYLGQCGIPTGPNSQVYIVDPQTGSDSNTGLSFKTPLLTLAAAEDLCVTNQNDVVILVGGPTSNALAATVAWDKDYTHLIGMSADLSVGQRCRVTGSGTVDLTNLMTISGDGCIFRNVQWNNEHNADEASGALTVTGNRNHFKNCMMAGMVHGNPASKATSFSLKLTGAAECLFENCWIGNDTIVRTAANAELVMSAGSSKCIFRDCRFASASSTAGKFMVSLDTDVGSGFNYWKDCLFYNNSVNWGTELTNCFTITGSGKTYYPILKDCQLVGIAGWSDVITHFYSSDPVGDAGAGVRVSLTG